MVDLYHTLHLAFKIIFSYLFCVPIHTCSLIYAPPHMQVRVVKGDDMWLSPNYQRDSCHLTMCIYNPTIKRRLDCYKKLYEAVAKFNPRFHWGKYFDLTPADMEKMYPRFKDFLKIRSQLDPSGLFLNEQLAGTFGLKHLL